MSRALDDPVGRELARWRRPNGLDICTHRTPDRRHRDHL
jgi:gamma-glutamyl phosphate reductase